jgi:hypothetical protein
MRGDKMNPLEDLNKAGGTAFPTEGELADESSFYYPGMTLRDYFAAQVVNGILSAEHDNREYGVQGYQEMAEQAYAIADAMLKERNKNA